MNSSQIRSMFLDFFEQRGHLVLPSYPLIPKDDPTLLLIGAGMAPFKPYFSGEVKPPRTRIATCQKCVRTPDIDRVGKTGRHATFFEMLGNFSFGDYFKVEAITWAWELVTEVYRLPRERLWVSVYEEDDEAFQIWQKRVGLPAERIIRLGKEDNFWEIGVGPCGPCSEIYYDLGPAVGCGQPGCAVGCDCDRFLEIWNLVFTQFSREPSGQLVPLKQKNIDTGAGLERLAMALQGVSSLYEIDLVQPIYNYIKSICGEAVAKDRQTALRIATEHSRGIVFLVADGVLPANEGRGYVLRRLLRRAVRFGRLLGIEGPFLSGVVPLIARSMGDAYPELLEKQEMIKQVISIEENRFLETLSQGMDILEQYIDSMRQEQNDVLPGKWAFKLYDTYGFPLDLTREILSERGLRVDEDSFHQCLADQQERARSARAKSGESGRDHRYRLAEEVNPRFAGYETLVTNTRVALILSGGTAVAEAQAGETVELFLECTPFYAEAGGQVGDTGTISLRQGRVQVESVFYTPAGQIVHRGTVLAGTVRKSAPATASTPPARGPYPRRSSPSWNLPAMKTPCARPSPWAATATPSPASPAASPTHFTERFPLLSRRRCAPCCLRTCWRWWTLTGPVLWPHNSRPARTLQGAPQKMWGALGAPFRQYSAGYCLYCGSRLSIYFFRSCRVLTALSRLCARSWKVCLACWSWVS
jgi:alanyl-tRNA synthetase